MIIIGAGLSGLLAATQFQTARVYESSPEGKTAHRALLRFRSSAVGDAVGIEFKKVRVHKGVWNGEGFVAPDIRLANQYSLKVLGRLGDRSIWNLDPVDRFIAPDDLMEQLVERVGKRIEWGNPVQFNKDSERLGCATISTVEPPTALGNSPIISTVPMNVLAKQLELKDTPTFDFLPIFVARIGVKKSDVYQTVYFPSPATQVYRASITGSTLIIESMAEIVPKIIADVLKAFGLDDGEVDRLENWIDISEQNYGKIAPIDDAWRRKFIVEATRRLNLYSLGRFAVWRNILVDDVLQDIAVIKKLLKGDAYASSLKGA